jgi:YVTN family beta-propeller protein
MPTGTVTMLFTDIEGSTQLLKQLGGRYGDLLSDHRRLLRAAFSSNGGREIDTQGDAFFVAFGRARDAVVAALDAQRALAAVSWPEGVMCRVRMGVHTAEPNKLVEEDGYHGIGLHRAARIAASAHGGQILVSSTTAELIRDDLPAGVTLRDLGRRRLKDIDHPEHLYQLAAPGLQVEFPPPRGAGGKPRRRSMASAALAMVVVAAVASAAVILATRSGSGSPSVSAASVSADSIGQFAAGSGRFMGDVPVGASPGEMATGNGSLWVVNVDAHTVSRVSAVKEVVIDTIEVGNDPDGIAFGDGYVWVANGLDGTVTKIDPRIDQPVDTIGVGNAPAGVVVDRHGIWVANSADGTLTRIDPRTDKPAPAISIGQSADGVAAGFDSIWVTNQLAGTVTRVDPSTGTVIPIQAGSGADAVAAGAGSIWVANSLGGTVTPVDPVSNTPRAAIAVGNGPSGITVANGSVWVSNELSGSLTRIDPGKDTATKTVTVGNRPVGITSGFGTLFAAVRASGAGHRGGTLTVLTSKGYLDNLDPSLAYNDPEYQVLVSTNDGLMGYRRVGGSAVIRLVPDLAVFQPTPTDGGRTYSFQVRNGIHYSNGALVQPADFRRAIERTLQLAPDGAYNAQYYADIVGARACLEAPSKPCDLSRGIETHQGSSTVTFHLVAPDPDFLYALDLPSAFAVPVGTPVRPRGHIPATGPYEIASFDRRHGARLVRNPRFKQWSPEAQPSGFPDVIVVRPEAKPDNGVRAVLHGAADLASGETRPSPALLAQLRTQHASQLEITPWAITYFVALNTRHAPFDDARARRALNLAVDRTRLRDLAFGPGLGQVTCQVIPPSLTGYRRYCPYGAPNLARARTLVRASQTAGMNVTVWMPANIPHFDKAAGRYLVSVLHRLGYRAQLRSTGINVATSDQAVFSGWYPDYPAPYGMVSALTCAAYNPHPAENLNYAGFCSPKIDREIKQAQSLETSDPKASSERWAAVDRDLTDAAPWLSFTNGVFVEVKSQRVGNYQTSPLWGTLLDQLWVR